MTSTQKKQPYDCDSAPSPTGAKTVLIIEFLAGDAGGKTASEIVQSLGFTANLVYRLLKTLAELGWVIQREDTKAYVLTNRLLHLSGPRVGEQSLAMAAHQALRELRDELGETVQLLIEVDGKMSVLEQFRGAEALQVCGQIGMRIPMYSCAPGKAMLANWSDEKLADWLRNRGRNLTAFTRHTLADPGALRTELGQIQACGYAVDRGEGNDGIHCVAVVIRDYYGQPVGAITTMAPASRLQEQDFEPVAQSLFAARRKIEEHLQN